MSHATQFLDFARERGVLRFGEFPLKSGRISPYFFNAGLFNSGEALARLGHFYAESISRANLGFDMLFGPAYKGIPLASAVAIALAEQYHRDIPYAFNRKEAKDHGEGGAIIGAPLAGRVLIIDDVITAGTAIREALALIRANGAQPVGVAVSLDRQERGRSERSSIQELKQSEHIEVISIATLSDLLAMVANDDGLESWAASIQAYRSRYGA